MKYAGENYAFVTFDLMICNSSPDINYCTGEFGAHEIHRSCRTHMKFVWTYFSKHLKEGTNEQDGESGRRCEDSTEMDLEKY
jgi:hypothetical protein